MTFSKNDFSRNLINQFAFYVFSIFKKNTKRKHNKNWIDKTNSQFQNISEIFTILKIRDSKMKKKINKTIKNWFRQHFKNLITKLTTVENQIKIRFLIKHLSQKYSIYFDELKSQTFIKNSFEKIVQKYFFNERRIAIRRHFTDRKWTQNRHFVSKRDQIVVDTSTIIESIFAFNLRMKNLIIRFCLNENIIFHVSSFNDSEFECFVFDILKNASLNFANLNVKHRAFMQKWRNIIDEQITTIKNLHEIRLVYRIKNEIKIVETDRNLKLMLIKIQNTKLYKLKFTTTSNNIFSKRNYYTWSTINMWY